MTDPQQNAFDSALGVGAVSNPWWGMYQDELSTAVMVAGFFLVLIRIILSLKELLGKKN